MGACDACHTEVPEAVRFCVACGSEVGDPLLNTVVGERYRLVQCIGRGGMGAVYRAEHTMMSKELAVKLLHPELGRLTEIADRFKREAEAACRLEHPNCIAVTDFGQTPKGALFLVMEYLRGLALADLIEKLRIEPERAVAIAKQVLAGLEHAHALGIVHRDLKPDNIMLIEKDGREVVKILDFGIAKLNLGLPVEEALPAATALPGSRASGSRPLTQAGSVFGTPEYIAPEQALGEETDARADLYSFGCVMYEMLTGVRPFQSKDKVELLSMHLTRVPTPARQVAPQAGISASLESIVAKAMAKKREDRFPSATAFLAALEALTAVGAVRAGPAAEVVREANPVGLTGALRVGSLHAMKSREPERGPIRTVLGAAWHFLEDLAKRRPWAVGLAGLGVVTVIIAIIAASSGSATRAQLDAADAGAAVVKDKPKPKPDEPPKPTAKDHIAAGHKAWDKRDPKAAAAAYAEAIDMDAALAAKDDKLLPRLGELAGNRSTESVALNALIAAGKTAAPELAAIASAGRTPDLRAKAAAALDKQGEAERIDTVRALALDAEQLKTCDKRAEAARKLMKSDDPRVVDYLARLAKKKGSRFEKDPSACFRKELVAELNKRKPPK